MNQVSGIEKLGNGVVDIFLRLIHGIRLLGFLGLVFEGKLLRLAYLWTVVVNVRVLSLPILLRENLLKTIVRR